MHTQLNSIAGGGLAMRDLHDTVTPTLPGIEPLPPAPPPRVTIAERRLICGYQGPKTVRMCRNCRHRGGVLNNVGSWAESVTHRCKLHDFPIALGALCADHED